MTAHNDRHNGQLTKDALLPFNDADCGGARGEAAFFIDPLRRGAERSVSRLQGSCWMDRNPELFNDLALFRSFAEASGQGFGMSDLEGRITYVNPMLAQLLGETDARDALGKHFSEYYASGYERRREEEILPVVREGVSWRGEVPIVNRKGETIPTLHTTFMLRNNQGEPVRIAVVITDLREITRAERSLRERHDQLQAICNAMADGLLIVDVETGRPLRANESFRRLMGYSEEELKRMSPVDVHPSDDAEQAWERFRAHASGQITRSEDVRLLRRDKSLFHADVTSGRIRYEGRPCVVFFYRDVTQRRQAEEALRRERRALRQLLQAVDHERQVIAYEIHDGLAQLIAGALMQFQVYERAAGSVLESGADSFQQGMRILRQSHAEVRRLISGVRPPMLDELGVVAAVGNLIQESRNGQRPKIEFVPQVQFDRLAPIEENAIYRIVQEALANARQHSQSERILVQLEQREDSLQVLVQDWGVGFDPASIGEGHFGLDGIRERARMLGGRAEIKTKPGSGTSVSVTLPMMQPAAGPPE
jgi:PAS domain S-box-containing protein